MSPLSHFSMNLSNNEKRIIEFFHACSQRIPPINDIKECADLFKNKEVDWDNIIVALANERGISLDDISRNLSRMKQLMDEIESKK